MDETRFARWIDGFEAVLSRRGLADLGMAALGALGSVGGADAKKKKKKPTGSNPGGCTAEPKATTCAGKCGNVNNNGGQSENCGSCEGYRFVAKWGGSDEGTGQGQFNTPEDVAGDGSGNVYVADRDDNRIQRFDSNGGFLAVWGGEESDEPGEFDEPFGVAVDSSGNGLVADRGNDRIQKLDSVGTPLLEWDSETGNSGFLNEPTDIAIDGADSVYVLEYFGMKVRKFTSQGVFVTTFGSEGTEDREFGFPQGVAVEADGNVCICGHLQRPHPRVQAKCADPAAVRLRHQVGIVRDGQRTV